MRSNQVPSEHRDPRHNVEINIGKICNNKCVFCLDGMPSKEDHTFMPFETMRAELLRWRNEGHLSVGFLGGEPTTYPQIIPAVKYAKELGFTRITLATNAMMLRRESFLDELLDAGLTRTTVSMHGHNAEVEDKLTMVPGGFEKKCTALRHLVARKKKGLLRDGVSVNIVLNGWNYRHLLEMQRFFFVDMELDDLRANFVRPEGYAEDNADLVPTYTSTVPYLIRAIAANEQIYKKVFTFGGVPMCVLPERLLADQPLLARYMGDIYRDLSTDCSIRSSAEHGTDDGVSRVESGRARFNWQERKRVDLKHQIPSCASCVFTNVCEGVWRGYLDIYEPGEFAPLTQQGDSFVRATPRLKASPEPKPMAERKRYHRRLLVVQPDS
jgi:MoaA/NifB/PqqE/SkfB family radical SAM enzyme